MSEENFYVNSEIYNDTDKPIPCNYSENFTTPFLDDAGEYRIAIVRFSLPNTNPIFIFQADKYYVTLVHNGQSFQATVQMENVEIVPSQNIMTFAQFMGMINTALRTVSTNLTTADPAITGTPFLTFEPASGLFSIHVPNSYIGTTQIYFNTDLYQFFENSFNVRKLSRHSASRQDVLFNTDYLQDSTQANYKVMRQDVNTTHEWYDYHSIIFTTANLPTREERISTKNSDGRSVEQNIVTDFIPDLNNDRSPFIYNADIYRWVDMRSKGNLKSFGFRVLYIPVNEGSPKVWQIPPGEKMSVKFLFQKK